MTSFYSSQWPPWCLCARGSRTLTLLSRENLCAFWKWSRQRSQTTCASSNGAPFLRENEWEQKKNEEQVQVPLVGEEKEKGFISEEWFAAGDVDNAYFFDDDVNELCTVPSCPVPEFSSISGSISLLTPCNISLECSAKPLLVYAPGMDCTGQGIIKQLPYLVDAGYDIRCIYIPSTDRSSWAQLVQILVPMLRQEKCLGGIERQVVLLGESFGGPLALRLAKEAPDMISRLVLVNPATNFQQSNSFASFWASTRLLAYFPSPLYKTAQDILLPLMVNRGRVKGSDYGDMFSPVDLVPAPCAAWRLSLLNDNTGLDNADINSIKVPTLLLSSSEDHVLSSVEETGRLNRLLPQSKRIILPGSGHTALLEDVINISRIMDMHGFSAPQASLPSKTNLHASYFTNLGKTAVQDEFLDEMGRLLEPWRFLTSPLVSGEKNLPSPELKRPILFVGNHTMFGVYDTPLLFHELFLRGFHCRGLAHPGHWRTFIGQLFESGTSAEFDSLKQESQSKVAEIGDRLQRKWGILTRIGIPRKGSTWCRYRAALLESLCNSFVSQRLKTLTAYTIKWGPIWVASTRRWLSQRQRK